MGRRPVGIKKDGEYIVIVAIGKNGKPKPKRTIRLSTAQAKWLIKQLRQALGQAGDPTNREYITKQEFCALFKAHGDIPEGSFNNRVGKLWSNLCRTALYAVGSPIVAICSRCEQPVDHDCLQPRGRDRSHPLRECDGFILSIQSLVDGKEWFAAQGFRNVGDGMIADLSRLITWLSQDNHPAP